MNKPLQQHATQLAYDLYDAIPKLPEQEGDVASRREPGRYRSGDLTFSIFNGSVSRSITWPECTTEYRLWFEVRGMVHFTEGNDRDILIYQQVVYDEFRNEAFRNRPNTFEGDIERFISVGDRLKVAMRNCILVEDQHEGEPPHQSEHLRDFVNVGSGSHEKRHVVIAVPRGSLTLAHYKEFAEAAYHDLPQCPAGLGGFVVLADTNAEVQGYNPRSTDVASWTQLIFRNASALNLELVNADNSLAVLAQKGKVTVEEVRLG